MYELLLAVQLTVVIILLLFCAFLPERKVTKFYLPDWFTEQKSIIQISLDEETKAKNSLDLFRNKLPEDQCKWGKLSTFWYNSLLTRYTVCKNDVEIKIASYQKALEESVNFISTESEICPENID